MANYLMIDFGSTFTKLTAVSSETEDIIATASHFTTVASDITIGYNNALKLLNEKIGKKIKFDKIIACSSAAGGLKMAAIGLIEELTVEAAKRVCLGAGARVDLVVNHHITNDEIQKIFDANIDIILLAGGTDGGNEECVLYNMEKLGQALKNSEKKIPIVYAGNKCCSDSIKEMFEKYGVDGYVVENVMPKINALNIDNARDKIREIFLNNIIQAKGIKKIENTIDKVILPTPEAVLRGATLLSKGYMDEDGFGELCLVDIGGATTDFYSISSTGAKRSDVVVKGLEEPYAKRTVEGDLGMRYSAIGVSKALSAEEIQLLNKDYSDQRNEETARRNRYHLDYAKIDNLDIIEEAKRRNRDVDQVYHEGKELYVDEILASICVDKACGRHAGHLQEIYSPLGTIYNQTGKDLTQVRCVIGTGGVLVNSYHPRTILSKLEGNISNIMELRPQHSTYMLDKDYIMASMGLLSDIDPMLALKIMKKHVVETFDKFEDK